MKPITVQSIKLKYSPPKSERIDKDSKNTKKYG